MFAHAHRSHDPFELGRWGNAPGPVAGTVCALDGTYAGGTIRFQCDSVAARTLGLVIQFAARSAEWNSLILLSFLNQSGERRVPNRVGRQETRVVHFVPT